MPFSLAPFMIECRSRSFAIPSYTPWGFMLADRPPAIDYSSTPSRAPWYLYFCLSRIGVVYAGIVVGAWCIILLVGHGVAPLGIVLLDDEALARSRGVVATALLISLAGLALRFSPRMPSLLSDLLPLLYCGFIACGFLFTDSLKATAWQVVPVG